MSAVVIIMIKSHESTTEVRGALESLFNAEFILEEDSDYTRHAAQSLGLELILIWNHGLVDDCGIPFSSFEYELDILLARRVEDHEVADLFQLTAGRFIFELITKTLGYSCALVFNL